MLNTKIPKSPPILSATASINSILLCRKVRIPCKISIVAPNATAIKKRVTSHIALLMGRAVSHRKVKPPKSTKCTHLSISGNLTSGIDFAGAKQPININKVHSMATNLACFLYGESGVNIRNISLCTNKLCVCCRI